MIAAVETWAWITFAGFAGFGLGMGLVLGAFIARTLRRYMVDADLKPYVDDEPPEDDRP